MDPDRDQLERIRAKAYAIVEADPGGPNADQARRILSKLPKNTVGQDAFHGPGMPKQITSGELPSGGDIGAELPPTPDEQVGQGTGPQGLSLPERAALVIASPSNRRQFERGMDDMLTFGLGQKAAAGVGRLVGDPAFAAETQADDERTSPNARTYGRVTGALTGKGLTGAVGKGALAVTSPLASAGKGMLGNTLLGAVRGGVANELAMPIISGGQAAVRGENPIPAMEEEAANPANALVGGLLGAGSGAARGIRESGGQTGRDIRLVEDYGAKPSPFGPKRGVFDSPAMRDVESGARDQGMASRRAAEKVMSTMDEEKSALSNNYGREKQSARDQGFLEGRIDTEAVKADVLKLMGRERLTIGQKNALQAEVIDALDRHPGGMTLDDLNDLRAKVGDIFGTGPGDAAHPALDTVRQSIKRAVDDTEMGPINENYSKGLRRIERQHEQLGTTEGGRRGVNERRIANIIQRRANDEAPGTGIQDAGDLGTDQFLAENPQHKAMFDVARLLAAKERMTAGINPEGGFYHRVGKHGLLEKNLEPALVGAYRLGAPLEKGGIPAALAAQFLLSGGPQAPVRPETFDLTGGK